MTGIDLDIATRGLATQPFAVLLGTRVVAVEAGRAVLELDVRADLLQQNGFVHGGVLAYLADNALTFAAAALVGPDVLTAGLTISYLRPAVGSVLRADAVAEHATARQVLSRCDVVAVTEDGEEKVVAAAQGTVAVRPR
ncbi:PaaI family thioesterase [Pseudonocardia sp. CA-107938]|uniref:PaaI family thioesterase n=1 Tax=Pseudonocardia sp. CA-107938 TaxID=3240021 RepID=UPI003D94D9AC